MALLTHHGLTIGALSTHRGLTVADLATIDGLGPLDVSGMSSDWDTGTKLAAPDADAGDWAGFSVALSGDYIIVGAPAETAGGTDAGAAYIFHRTGTNTWDAGVKLVAPDADASAIFGYAVSIDGDYAIVGAPGDDAGGSAAGAAYIFHRTGTNTWDSGTKVVASDAEPNDFFGRGVGISGDYAIVGASGDDDGGGAAGAAHIFYRTGTNTWDTGTKIVAPDAADNDYFGESVAISGDYAIAGAFGEDAGGSAAGAAYIFHRTGTNTWDSGTKIVASDAAADDNFGRSVAIDGDYAIVGAPGEDAEGSAAGAAYIFHRTGTNTWDAGVKLAAPDAEANDFAGYSVAISGDYAIVGAPGEDAGGSAAGAAYACHRTGTNTWDTGVKLVASDAEAGDSFAYSVAIDGAYAVAGAQLEDAGGSAAGAAYAFYNDEIVVI